MFLDKNRFVFKEEEKQLKKPKAVVESAGCDAATFEELFAHVLPVKCEQSPGFVSNTTL